MQLALALAREAAEQGEVPVGAVIADANGAILSAAHNLTKTNSDPTAHAEILAIRAAARKLQSERLTGCTLTVTLEPCAMCAAAIAEARIPRLVYAASDPKGGGVEHGARIFQHRRPAPEIISSIAEAEAAAMLRDFFRTRRAPG